MSLAYIKESLPMREGVDLVPYAIKILEQLVYVNMEDRTKIHRDIDKPLDLVRIESDKRKAKKVIRLLEGAGVIFYNEISVPLANGSNRIKCVVQVSKGWFEKACADMEYPHAQVNSWNHPLIHKTCFYVLGLSGMNMLHWEQNPDEYESPSFLDETFLVHKDKKVLYEAHSFSKTLASCLAASPFFIPMILTGKNFGEHSNYHYTYMPTKGHSSAAYLAHQASALEVFRGFIDFHLSYQDELYAITVSRSKKDFYVYMAERFMQNAETLAAGPLTHSPPGSYYQHLSTYILKGKYLPPLKDLILDVASRAVLENFKD